MVLVLQMVILMENYDVIIPVYGLGTLFCKWCTSNSCNMGTRNHECPRYSYYVTLLLRLIILILIRVYPLAHLSTGFLICMPKSLIIVMQQPASNTVSPPLHNCPMIPLNVQWKFYPSHCTIWYRWDHGIIPLSHQEELNPKCPSCTIVPFGTGGTSWDYPITSPNKQT